MDRLSFWNSRSNLGFAAGSGDTNLKTLEINAIREALGTPSSVLDAGCGNGYTLCHLADKFPSCSFYGFDYSDGMISSANTLISTKGMSSMVKVCQASLLDNLPHCISSILPESISFDCIYTERSIINLDSIDQQLNAIESLWNLVASGGRLILCEAFIDGLHEINAYRSSIGLDQISPPWHNRYLSLSEIPQLASRLNVTPKIVEFSGTYYFVSRVIHAKEALVNNQQPVYDSPLNLLSLDMPALPMFGQSKLLVFTKP